MSTLSNAFVGTAAGLKTKVILAIFTPDAEDWTESPAGLPSTRTSLPSGDYTTCYPAGAECPLDHSVCAVEHCNLQRWREIIGLLRAAGEVEVTEAACRAERRVLESHPS